VRVNFNYFLSEPVVEYILDAVDLVASDGWRLLPDYRFEHETGFWRHVRGSAAAPMSLLDIRYEDGRMRWPSHRRQAPESALRDYLEEGREVLRADPDTSAVRPHELTPEVEALRWFWLPEELNAPSPAALREAVGASSPAASSRASGAPAGRSG
jgi:hypothetical protein